MPKNLVPKTHKNFSSKCHAQFSALNRMQLYLGQTSMNLSQIFVARNLCASFWYQILERVATTRLMLLMGFVFEKV